MTRNNLLYLHIVALFTAFAVANGQGQELYTSACVDPLLENGKSLCSQMDGFSQCHIDSSVPRDNLADVLSSLRTMSAALKKFKQEQCDLNLEFNNECAEDFVDCMQHVTVGSGDNLSVDCGTTSLVNLYQCTRKVLPDFVEPCYFGPWVEKIVERAREVVCAQATQAPPPEYTTDVNEEPSSSGLGESSGYCDAGAIRFHVYKHCTVFQKEWVAQGIRYDVQSVAPGTLFDTGICGQKHASEVAC